MKKIRKYKNVIERFLSGESGQRFFNFAYSIGAAVVIWGALFKILHLPGGNTLLCIGMGTEVLMFILTAFDRPSRDYHWEEVFPVLASRNPADRPDFAEGNMGGGTVIINGVASSAAAAGSEAASARSAYSSKIDMPVLTGDPTADVAAVTGNYIDRMNAITEQMTRLQESTEALNAASDTLLTAYRAITENSDSVGASSSGYVEQMQALNRNIQGLNTIYEIQLKSVSSQLDAIDRVNRGIKDIRDMYERSANQSSRYAEETEKMAHHMQQLNMLYERMIQAMTINMYNPAAPLSTAAPRQTEDAQPESKA
ncbi:MAG: gliding motility protein GldL [Bacteroides sp.]|nr:gliding motility protein GldL [Bacteroides sp.]